MSSALKTTTKNIPSFLSKLSSVTNTGVHSCDTQMLFQNQHYSTNQPVNSRSPQYTTPSKQSLTGKYQAPQSPLTLVTTLKPMLKEFQLLPDKAAARKQMDPHTRLRQAPQPPLSPTKTTPSSELIAKLEQTIKADKQSPDGAAWYARYNTALITNLEQAIKEDKQSPDGAAWYARHNSPADHSPKIRRTPMPSLSPELEQMAYDAGFRIRHDSTGIIPTKVRHSLLSSIQINKPEKMTENDKQSSSNKIPAQQTIHEKLRVALNDFHQDPEMARAKWIPVKKT